MQQNLILKDVCMHKFAAFTHVSVSSVLKDISGLSNKYSHFDFLPTCLLKGHATFFTVPIAHLANLSFGQPSFPTSLKTGVIKPIKKPGLDMDDPVNYWPITKLGTFSKICERLALEQLTPHVIESPKFPSCQSAYRSFYSTETALLKITNDLRCNMNSESLSCLLSLDISAAFDVLDH